MPACVLRVTGVPAAAETATRASGLAFVESRPSMRRRRGGAVDPRSSTYSWTVAEFEEPADWAAAFERASDALVDARDGLVALLESDGVQGGCFDIGLEVDVALPAVSCRLPARLVEVCADLGLDVEVSVYPVAADQP